MVSREKRRLSLLLYSITAIVALTILLRIFWVAVITGNTAGDYSDPQVSTRIVRGTITDTNGRLLAMETPYYACALLLRQVPDLQATARILGPLLSVDPQTIVQEASENSLYYLVKRRLGDTEYEQVSALIQDKKLPGVILEKRYGRLFPQHFHAAQVVGFTNTENRGIEGLELAYEQLLSPYPEIGTSLSYGNTIALTLDLDLQYLLDTQVVAIDREHYPDSIVGIIMGADTGEILAATTFPWYDPNLYQESEPEQRQNRVVTSMYEPGSVFKIFSLAAELAAGQADFAQPFHCDGSYTFTMPNGSETTINCVSPHGTITPETMLKYSCNGAVAHWALQTDDELFRKTITDLGFGSVWKTGMPGTIGGLVSRVDAWSGRTKATMSFGQELGVTALQLATAATAIANQGTLMSPYIVESIVDHTGTLLHKGEPTVANTNVFDAKVASTILSGMVEATRAGGTATRTAVEGVLVAAKTGTAQIADPTTGSYGADTFLASTLAIVPADNPKYIIYIGVANPTGATIWGSNIAAPAIGSIIADMVRQGKLVSDSMEHIKLPAGVPLPE